MIHDLNWFWLLFIDKLEAKIKLGIYTPQVREKQKTLEVAMELVRQENIKTDKEIRFFKHLYAPFVLSVKIWKQNMKNFSLPNKKPLKS